MAKTFPSSCSRSTPQSNANAVAPSVRDWLECCNRHHPLAERTVLELSRRIQIWQRHAGGPEQAPLAIRRRAIRARDQLVRHNLRLIAHTWSRHRSTLPAHEEGTADAFQEAALSLVRAAEKYDPSRGYCFSTYASFWVRRGFSEHERRGRRLIRFPHDKAALVLKAQRQAREAQALSGSMPSIETLAQRCGPRDTPVAVQQLQELLVIWWRTAAAELDRPCGLNSEGEQQPLLDRIADPSLQEPCPMEEWIQAADFPDARATLAQCAADGLDPQRALLPLLLQRLTPEQRRLLWHRYLREHPLSPRQIKKVMGLSLAEQERLEREALLVLREGVVLDRVSL